MTWPIPATLAVLLLLASSCAKQQFPPGGPEDKTAPEVVSTEPEHGSVLVNLMPTINISFSERMDKQRTREAVFVSPPPDGEVRIDWKKSALRLSFADSLAENRTYLVTVGSGAADEHNNRLEESFTLAFSTGEILDSGVISGAVRKGGASLAGATVVAYSLEDANSPGLLARPPEYTTQTGLDGTYGLSYVSAGDYVLFAFEDRNRDRKWNPPGESIGFPLLPALISSEQSFAASVDFDIFQRDTSALRVEDAAVSQDRVLRIRLSQAILRSTLPRARFLLVSLDDLDTVRIDQVYAWDDSSKAVAAPMPDLGHTEAVSLQIDSLFDLWGNAVNTVADSIMLQAPVGSDRRPPSVEAIVPPDGSRDVEAVPAIRVRFDEPVKIISDTAGLALIDPDSVVIVCAPEQIDRFTVQFTPKDSLRQGTTYNAALAPGVVSDLAGNLNSDSAAAFTIETVNYDSLGSFSGTAVLGHMGPEQTPRIFYRMVSGGQWAELEYDQFGRFFHTVAPGKYCFTGFIDRNGDGFLSTGSLSPFDYAEPVLVFADTVTVRSRFETEEIELRIE